MNKLSMVPVMVLMTALSFFCVLMICACQSGEQDGPQARELSPPNKAAVTTTRANTTEAGAGKVAKDEEQSSSQETTQNTEARDHGKDPEHKPCPSNFVVQPEEGEKISQGVNDSASPKEKSSKLDRIIYITTSRACACTMKRCEKTDKLIKEMKKTYDGMPLVTINYAEETQKARKLAEKYKTIMLPIILFLEEDGSPLVKMSGEIKEEEAKKAFAQFFAKSE